MTGRTTDTSSKITDLRFWVMAKWQVGFLSALSLWLSASAGLAQAPPPPAAQAQGTISDNGLTVPSLWLAQQLFGGKLIASWRPVASTDPSENQVELVVRREVWRIMDYLNRYDFINRFGTAASDFRYNLQVVDAQGTLLGAYICQFGTSPGVTAQIDERNCQVVLASDGVGRISGGLRRPF